MLLSSAIIDFYLFYYGAIDVHLLAHLTKVECGDSNTEVTVKAMLGVKICEKLLIIMQKCAIYRIYCTIIMFLNKVKYSAGFQALVVFMEKKADKTVKSHERSNFFFK